MTHLDFIPKYLKGRGVEIGAFKTPIPGIKPIYVDKFEEFAGEPCKADYFGESVSLPFLDASLDYVAASHVLEHCANPIKALTEWCRVLKPGGIAYIVVPDKRHTWDRARPITQIDHMLEDYKGETSDCDATHVDDFVYGIDWQEIFPDVKEDEIDSQRKAHSENFKKEVSEGKEINIHFHVFDPSNFRQLLESVSGIEYIPISWHLLEYVERFPEDCPHGILAILKKNEKGRWGNIISSTFSKMFSSKYPLMSDAKAFPSKAS